MPPLTGLVNNAGIFVPGANLEMLAQEDVFHMHMNINALGPLLCCREAVKRMSTNNNGRGGSIVNISSGSGVLTGALLYSMSKQALNAMSKILVMPMAKHGIRINTVIPGKTKTDMIAGRCVDVSTIPLGRLGMPEDTAKTVSYLMSGNASFVTGANVHVSGGRSPGIFLG